MRRYSDWPRAAAHAVLRGTTFLGLLLLALMAVAGFAVTFFAAVIASFLGWAWLASADTTMAIANLADRIRESRAMARESRRKIRRDRRMGRVR